MESSRISKLKEIRQNASISDVLILFETTDFDINIIAEKTNLTPREVEIIFATKELINCQKPKKLHLIKFNDDTYIDVNKIVAVQSVKAAYGSIVNIYLEDKTTFGFQKDIKDIMKIIDDAL